MGTKMAPSYANLFMASLESRFLKNQPLTPLVWWRFTDDIFSIWTHGRPDLDCFLHQLNPFHPTMGLMFSISDVEGVFLDASARLHQSSELRVTSVREAGRQASVPTSGKLSPPHVTPAISHTAKHFA